MTNRQEHRDINAGRIGYEPGLKPQAMQVWGDLVLKIGVKLRGPRRILALGVVW